MPGGGEEVALGREDGWLFERPRDVDTAPPSHTGGAEVGCECGLWSQRQLCGREFGAEICVTPHFG